MHIVSLKNINKTYHNTNIQACNNASLDVYAGETLAIIGENGAGKSTLMKILYGLERLDSGTIEYRGNIVKIDSVFAANKLSIGMVQQHDSLISEFSVLDNIVLGEEHKKYKCFLDRKTSREKINNVISKYNLDIDINTKVKYLNPTQKKQIAILKAIHKNANLIILDEPTASMSEGDALVLYKMLCSLKESKITIIIITHKIKDILNISDRIAIMKAGSISSIYNTKTTDEIILSNLLMNDLITTNTKHSPRRENLENNNRSKVISFKNVFLKSKSKSMCELFDINFSVCEGDILAVTAMEGNGLRELEDLCSGFSNPTNGEIFYRNKNITKQGVLNLRKNNMAYVPSDRMQKGSCLSAMVFENAFINKRKPFSKFGFMNMIAIKKFTLSVLNYMQVKAKQKQYLKTLSGGNIQRLILSREIKQIKDYIILAEPTQGLDFQSQADIHKEIQGLKKNNVAIILLSSDLSEVLKLADKIVILYRGSIIKNVINNNLLNEADISKYMVGIIDA